MVTNEKVNWWSEATWMPKWSDVKDPPRQDSQARAARFVGWRHTLYLLSPTTLAVCQEVKTRFTGGTDGQ